MNNEAENIKENSNNNPEEKKYRKNLEEKFRDFLIRWPKIHEFYCKYEEILTYLVVGGTTTLVAWAAKFLFNFLVYENTMDPTNFQTTVLSTVNWTAGVIYGYFANRAYVFKSHAKKWPEFLTFTGSRVSTYFLELLIMNGFALINVNLIVATVVAAILVIIGNYILSKFIVFRKKKERFGIIGAMEAEVKSLIENMKVQKVVEKAGMKFYVGTLGKANVVIVQSGVGKINAACCVQILVDCFKVSSVINTGIAGSLNAKIDIGDFVVSKEAVHHDVDVTIFGYKLGQVPGFKNREFTADENLIKLAEETCMEVNTDINVYVGRVASGDQFVAGKDIKEKLVKEFEADCTEMEGASVAQAATLNNLPFVIVRAISDKADDSASMDYPEFEAKAAVHSANLIIEMMNRV